MLLFIAVSLFLASNWEKVLTDIQNWGLYGWNLYPIVLVACAIFLLVRAFNNLTRIDKLSFFNADKNEWIFTLVYIIAVAIILKENFLYSIALPPYIIAAVLAGIVKILTPPIRHHDNDDF